jgi:hypothetical protein
MVMVNAIEILGIVLGAPYTYLYLLPVMAVDVAAALVFTGGSLSSSQQQQVSKKATKSN